MFCWSIIYSSVPRDFTLICNFTKCRKKEKHYQSKMVVSHLYKIIQIDFYIQLVLAHNTFKWPCIICYFTTKWNQSLETVSKISGIKQQWLNDNWQVTERNKFPLQHLEHTVSLSHIGPMKTQKTFIYNIYSIVLIRLHV